MFCPSCGKEIPDESRYCLACGKSPSAILNSSASAPSSEEPRESHWLRNIVFAFIILMALYSAVFLIHRATNGRFLPMLGTTLGTTRRDPLTPSLFTVKAGTIYFVRFNVETTGRVVGRFQVSGGQGNDIQAVITDADNFENWRNGHQARVLYQTDKTTIGNIDVPIGRPGTYYIGFNNNFSLLSDKTVSASILLDH